MQKAGKTFQDPSRLGIQRAAGILPKLADGRSSGQIRRARSSYPWDVIGPPNNPETKLFSLLSILKTDKSNHREGNEFGRVLLVRGQPQVGSDRA